MKLEKLVESLSSTERMYFRKFGFRVEKQEGHVLRELFEILCENTSLKDGELAKLLNVANQQKIRFHKHALKERLLEVLSDQELSAVQAKILSYYHQASWLKERNAMEEAIKRVRKGMDLALECSRFALLLEGQSLEKKLLRAHTLWIPQEKDALDLNDQIILKTVGHFIETEKYLSIDHKLFSLGGRRGRDITSEKHNEELESLIAPLLSGGTPSEENYEAYCLHFLSLSRYYGSKKQIQNKLNTERHLIDFILKHPEKSKHFSATFPTVLNNYLNTCIDLELYDDYEKYRVHFDYHNKNISIRLRARIFLMAANLSLNCYLKQGRLSDADEELIQYEMEAKTFYTALEPEYFHVFHINAAIVCFGNFMYKNCIRWCQKLLAKGIRSPNRDIIRIVYILSICSHSSLGNHSNVKSLLGRYLRQYQEEDLMETEKHLYNYFKSTFTEIDPKENIRQLTESVRKSEVLLKEKELMDLVLLKPWLKLLQKQ